MLVSALIVVVPFALAALLSRGRGMGWGDVKLAAVAGALLGASNALLALALAAFAAAVGARFRRDAGAAPRPLAFAPVPHRRDRALHRIGAPMTMWLVRNARPGRVLAWRVRRAEGWLERTVGFLPRAAIAPEEGMWFEGCHAVHTVGMRTPLDIVFLDRELRVVRAE